MEHKKETLRKKSKTESSRCATAAVGVLKVTLQFYELERRDREYEGEDVKCKYWQTYR